MFAKNDDTNLKDEMLMTELSVTEIEDVSGGVVPLIVIAAAAFAGGFAGGYAAGQAAN